MLPLPELQVHRPTTVEEAVALHQRLERAMYLAGGTDVLPNLKHHLYDVDHLIALQGIPGLDTAAHAPDGRLALGAGLALEALVQHPVVRGHAPALADAASRIAGPQHRRMGTLGGNVLLDTRCVFYNQSKAWRTALGSCLKAEGTWCHVIGSAKGCVAAQSSDTVPVLLAFGATLRAVGPEGPVEMPLEALYGTDGRRGRHLALPPGALLTHVVLPPIEPGVRSVYRKVRPREAIDFPQLGVAAVGRFEGDRCVELTVVLGALLPKPRAVGHIDRHLPGPLDDARIDAIAEHAWKQARPQPQIHGDPSWRRDLVKVEVARALRALRG